MRNLLMRQLNIYIDFPLLYTYTMKNVNGLNQTIATEYSDLKYGEYRCTECNKVITREQVIPNDRGQSITTNSINFCSSKCRSENRNGYDRMVSF